MLGLEFGFGRIFFVSVRFRASEIWFRLVRLGLGLRALGWRSQGFWVFRAKGFVFGWVSRFGSSVSGLGLGFLAFLGLRVFGWLVFLG